MVLLASAWAGGAPPGAAAQMSGPPLTTVAVDPLVRTSVSVADSIFMAGDPGRALAVLQGRLDGSPDDFGALWRATRAAFALGLVSGSWHERVRWLRVANGYGNRLLALRPDDSTALEWAAAAKGRLAIENGDPLTTVRLGEQVWALTDTLLAQKPDDPMGNDIRGKLFQELLRLSWGKRVLARILMRHDPVSSVHWSDAERCLQRAVKGDPAVVLYYVDLGDTYRLQGKDRAALRVYREGLAVPDLYPWDQHYKGYLRNAIGALERQPDSRAR